MHLVVMSKGSVLKYTDLGGGGPSPLTMWILPKLFILVWTIHIGFSPVYLAESTVR
jgi:hypothetical protein